MILEIIFQVGFLIFALASAKEEHAFTYPFREIGGTCFPWEMKYKKMKQAHNAGARGVFYLLVMAFGVEVAHYEGPLWLVASILLPLVCGLIYWQAFDSGYAVSNDVGPFYLGSTARIDKWLNKHLGKNAGVIKALFCVLLIIAINLIYGLLLY